MLKNEGKNSKIMDEEKLNAINAAIAAGDVDALVVAMKSLYGDNLGGLSGVGQILENS